MEVAANNTLYINNVNEKIKQPGKTFLGSV